MPVEIGIWRIGESLQQMDFVSLDLEGRLQDMLDQDIAIAAPNWIVIGREVHTSSGKRVDLLAMDRDGNLIVIEMKRDKTYRDIIAQVLDYGSWVKDLRSEAIAQIFSSYVSSYHPERGTISLDEAFRQRFRVNEMPDELNLSHQLVIVASSLDPATERIVRYLAETHNVSINAIFFRVFKDGDREYLARAWLSDPTQETDTVPMPEHEREWNGEYYVSFGEDEHRNWNDAREYGFVSAGGGNWYTNTLFMLEPGNRIWVNVPGKGYVGVGKVVSPTVRFDKFSVRVGEGRQVPITELKGALQASNMFDEEHSEHLVAVQWIKTVPVDQAVKEKGFFGNQNTVAKPTSQKWDHTVARLKIRFGVE